MKMFAALAGSSLLLLGSAAVAQDMSQDVQGPADAATSMPAPAPDSATPMDAMPPAETTTPDAAGPAPTSPAPGSELPAAPGDQAFTDAEIDSFASAALEIQELNANPSLDTTTKQQQAAAIVADAGIDAETFNAIGQAMQSDPDVAQRVQLAAADQQGQPES